MILVLLTDGVNTERRQGRGIFMELEGKYSFSLGEGEILT